MKNSLSKDGIWEFLTVVWEYFLLFAIENVADIRPQILAKGGILLDILLTFNIIKSTFQKKNIYEFH